MTYTIECQTKVNPCLSLKPPWKSLKIANWQNKFGGIANSHSNHLKTLYHTWKKNDNSKIDEEPTQQENHKIYKLSHRIHYNSAFEKIVTSKDPI